MATNSVKLRRDLKLYLTMMVVSGPQGTMEAIKVANDCDVKLMTAFQRRFDPSFSRLHQLIADVRMMILAKAALRSIQTDI